MLPKKPGSGTGPPPNPSGSNPRPSQALPIPTVASFATQGTALHPAPQNVDWTSILAGMNLAHTGGSFRFDEAYYELGCDRTCLDDEARKNEHEMNPSGIPDTLFMMGHLKLFIPISMLTTSSIARIRYNNNLKFKKIPLDVLPGSIHWTRLISLWKCLTKYMQAHKHWLTLIKLTAESVTYKGWKDRMMDDPGLIKWECAWCSHE